MYIRHLKMIILAISMVRNFQNEALIYTRSKISSGKLRIFWQWWIRSIECINGWVFTSFNEILVSIYKENIGKQYLDHWNHIWKKKSLPWQQHSLNPYGGLHVMNKIDRNFDVHMVAIVTNMMQSLLFVF